MALHVCPICKISTPNEQYQIRLLTKAEGKEGKRPSYCCSEKCYNAAIEYNLEIKAKFEEKEKKRKEREEKTALRQEQKFKYICPICKKETNSEEFEIVPILKNGEQGKKKQHCCSQECFDELVRLGEERITAGIEKAKQSEELLELKRKIEWFFGRNINPQQWKALMKHRTKLKEKYDNLTDKKIMLVLEYAYNYKGWARKEPSLAAVDCLYEEAREYYLEEQRKNLEIQKQFKSNPIKETKKINFHYQENKRQLSIEKILEGSDDIGGVD